MFVLSFLFGCTCLSIVRCLESINSRFQIHVERWLQKPTPSAPCVAEVKVNVDRRVSGLKRLLSACSRSPMWTPRLPSSQELSPPRQLNTGSRSKASITTAAGPMNARNYSH